MKPEQLGGADAVIAVLGPDLRPRQWADKLGISVSQVRRLLDRYDHRSKDAVGYRKLDILQALEDLEGGTVREVCEHLGTEQRGTSRHMAALRQWEMVRRKARAKRRKHGAAVWELTSAGRWELRRAEKCGRVPGVPGIRREGWHGHK